MEKLTKFIMKYNIMVLLAIVLLTVASVLGIKNNFYLETNLDKYMPADHPAFLYSDEAEEMFDIRDAIMIAIENKDGIYNQTTLNKIKSLSKDIMKLDVVEEKADVLSLYTADNIKGSEEGLEIEEFFKRVPKTEEGLAELRDAIRVNEMVYKRIVSEDETSSLIMTKIRDNSFSTELYDEINELANKYSGDGDKLYVAGQPIIEGTMGVLMPEDMKKMFPIVLILIIVVLLLVLRSAKGMVITMLIVILSSLWTFGLMLTLGYPIYAITTLIPIMLIAIGVADGIHIYSHLQLTMLKHEDWSKKELIIDMISQMWKPVAMTSVTTAIGFLSLLTSDVYPIKYFAVFTALGVLFAMVLSLTLIPALTQLGGLPNVSKPRKGNKTFFEKYADGITSWLIGNKKWVFTATFVIILISGFGISKVWINSSFLARFPDSNPLVETDHFVNSKFSGTTTVNVILESGEEGKFKNPEVLKLMDKVAHEVDSEMEVVGGTLSVNDFIKRMNKVLNEDRESHYKIPDDRELIAQYFLLYEMSGGSDNLWEVVDQDFKTANLRFQLKSDDSKGLDGLISKLETYQDDFEAQGVALNFAGGGYKLLVFGDMILTGQIKSLILSFFVVFILLSFMFRSVRVGLIGIIPIVITTIISFGILGLFNIPLETTTALISSIAIGIGIDYAVHFIDRYKINAINTGDRSQTIINTMGHSGRAISYNAVVVILGFLVLIFSAFKPNIALGVIVSLNMFTSFLATVTVMFLVMYVNNIYFKKKNKK